MQSPVRLENLRKRIIFIGILLMGITNCFTQKTLNPIQFGLLDAITTEERFYVLYRTHCEAIKTNSKVSYKGIGEIIIEIPSDAKRIPLTYETDFAGARLSVKNNSKDHFIFELTENLLPIEVAKAQIDDGVFSSNSILSKGRYILYLEDSNPWVKERIGYNHPVIRKDILLIIDGKAINKVIAPYNNSWTKVKAYYREVPNKTKAIKNLKFYREPGNNKMAFFVCISNQDKVLLSDIEIYTPDDNLKGDNAIAISNCTNVVFRRVAINGTYSHKDKYGYGVAMENVWNCSFNKFYGHGNWGVFGCNNVSQAKFVDCDMNRFDIHCYGRDVYFKGCVFRDLYNQFSSVFGTISFTKCEFINFIPVSIESTYNAYTKFEIVMKNCTVRDCSYKNYILSINGFQDSIINERPELKEKNWPNFKIDGLTIYSQNRDTYRLSNMSDGCIQEENITIPTVIKVKRIKRVLINQNNKM